MQIRVRSFQKIDLCSRRSFTLAIDSARKRVPLTRLSRISFFRSVVQRPEATFSPASDVYRVAVEERALLATLGDPYAAYLRRTKRFIPGLF